MNPAFLIAGAIMVGLTFYALFGGADYGGGVWDLLAWGPRRDAQRELIAHAIGPVWEANHVWLILVIVLLFTAFPPAFARISMGLHVPLALLLIGIICRGSSFTFRAYAPGTRSERHWGKVFAVASLITPILLGIVIGGVSSGALALPVKPDLAWFFSWVAPFPFAVGLFALVLFALLAAVYLAVEAPEPGLQDDFRKRAIAAELLAGVLALIVFFLAAQGAPYLRGHLAASWWTWPLQLGTGASALAVLAFLGRRKYHHARVAAAFQVALILWGWGLAQLPYLAAPDLTVLSASAPIATLHFLAIALVAGALLLFPSLAYLFRVFKG